MPKDENSPPILIIKEAPSDETYKKVLTQLYESVRPKWKLPLDLIVGTMFVVAAGFIFATQSPVPPGAWVALVGAIVAFAIAFGYIPLLVSMTIKANKKASAYTEKKTYRFYKNYMLYSMENGQNIEIPLEKFTKVLVSNEFVLFMINGKLALWFGMSDVSMEDLATILVSLENNGVEIDHRS